MYGLQAINAANGWTITVLGISIVFSGLTILAVLIASIERFLGLWDRRAEFFKPRRQISVEPEDSMDRKRVEFVSVPQVPEAETVYLTPQQVEIANYFQLIIQRIGEPFSLPNLLKQAENRGISRPHSHLDIFLQSGLIVECEGDQSGFYRWQKDTLIVSEDSKMT